MEHEVVNGEHIPNGAHDDRDSWPTKLDIVRETGISERTIERKIQAGELRREFRNVPGRKPIVIIHPEDAAKLRAETLQPIPMPRNELVKATPQPDMAAFLSALRPALTLDKKLYLTLDEAAQYSGLPKNYLKRKIREGVINAVKLSGWRIKRSDLETHNAASYRHGGALGETAEKKEK